MQDRGFGEEPHPAGVAPEQYYITFGFQALFQLPAQLLAQVIHLVQTAEHHWHALQSVDGRLDFRDPDGGQQAGIEIAGLHQSDHVCFTPLCAIGKNRQPNRAGRRLTPLLSHGQQTFMI
jgi:hypothetical protein